MSSANRGASDLGPLVSCFDRFGPGYPDAFERLPGPPARVYVQGRLPNGPTAVAIVGARRASVLGRELARSLGRAASEAGVIVVSGGALGVDAEAHEGALEAGGPTIAVLPTPVWRPTPSANRELFFRIVNAKGALLSERGDGPTLRRDFCLRNRLIAALVSLVVVVEARAGSGTLHTVRWARRLGREVAAVPWSVNDPRGEACLAVLESGGRPVVDEAGLLALLGIRKRVRRSGTRIRGRKDRSSDSPLGDGVSRPLRDAMVRRSEAELGLGLAAGGPRGPLKG